MRQRLSIANRARLLTLLVAALVVRALVPTGWMPVATADGVRLELCAGQAAQPMAGMHHGHGQDGKPMPADHPCAFAGLGMAVDTAPSLAALPVVPVTAAAVVARALAVSVGQGLAAPPPPATGPPAFA